MAPAATSPDPSGYAQLRGVSFCADSADCTAVATDSAAHEAAYAVESEGAGVPVDGFPDEQLSQRRELLGGRGLHGGRR